LFERFVERPILPLRRVCQRCDENVTVRLVEAFDDGADFAW